MKPPTKSDGKSTPKLPELRPEAYRGAGLLAVHPSAFGLEFLVASCDHEAEPFELHDNVAIVRVEGPLEATRRSFFDNYESIVERVQAALASADAAAVVLSIDSPGGSVAGMLDASRALASAASAAGKLVIAHIGGQARSAGYALAAGCSLIAASDTALVGNVGVLYSRIDATRADEEIGVRYHIIASGEHKADENPHVEMSDSAASELQAAVDTLAGMYAALVLERRPGLALDAVGLLVGRSYVAGANGVALGLIDAVLPLGELVSALAQDPSGGAILPTDSDGPTAGPPDQYSTEEDRPMNAKTAKALKAAIAALTNALAAEGEDDNDNGEESKAEGEDKEESKAEGDEDKGDDMPDAEGEDEEDKEESKSKASAGASAQASASDAALTALTSESAKRAAAEARAEAAEREALFASRGDLSPELKASLSAVPIAEARAIVAAIKPPKGKPALDARGAFVPDAAKPTEGDAKLSTETGPTRLSAQADELDRRFGLTPKAEPGVSYDPTQNVMTFGRKSPAAGK